jgi:hypothetical protein
MTVSLRRWTLLLALAWAGFSSCGIADERTAAELLPATTVIYAEFPDLSAALDVVLKHPLRERVESLEEYQQAVQKKEYLAFQGVLQYVESRIGMTWREAIAALTDGGLTLAMDAPTEGVVLLSKARDEATLTTLRDEFLRLAREDAKSKGKSDPYRSRDYRGVTVYEANGGGFATVGPWFVAVNKGDLGKGVLDRLLDAGGDSLAGNERFAPARKAAPDDTAGWAWFDIDVIREAQATKGKPFATQTDNPLAELLVGGLLDTLQHTPYLTASLTFETQTLGLSFAMPHEPGWVTESRHYFFGPEGKGVAPAVPAIDGLLFSFASYRDISEMWLRGGDLFNQNVADKLAEADSNLSMFFGGKDFGEDVLGSFEPEVLFVAARQVFADDQPQPAIRLPAFAFVFDMKDPDTMRRELRRTFQSAIGFINVLGAMNGQPQLELDMATADGVELVTSSYLPDAGKSEPGEARIHFNFSPPAAFAGKKFILASTADLARQLAAAPTTDVAAAGLNTSVRLDMPQLQDVLEDNRAQLISQNMLEEGRSREEAEQQIGALLAIVGVLRDLSVELQTEGNQITLDLQLRLLAP